MDHKEVKALSAGILVAIVIMGPLLDNEFLFLLDSHPDLNPVLLQDYRLSKLFLGGFHFLISDFAPWLYPKGIMFFSIIMSFFFTWVLLTRYVDTIPAYLFSYFFAVNPFIYNRMITGQIFILFSYSLLPLFLMVLLRKRNLKRDILLGLIISFASLQLHFLPIMIGMVILFRLSDYSRTRKKEYLSSLAIIFLTVLTFEINTFFQLISGGEIKDNLSSISSTHIQAFKPHMAPGINHLASVATLHGFWRQDAYKQIWDYFPKIWFFTFATILFFSVHGYLQKPRYRMVFAFLGIIGLVLGTGIANSTFDSLFLFFFENVPTFRGFRDPQKLVVLLVLAYTYLGVHGFQDIYLTLKKKYRKQRIFSYGFSSLIFLIFVVYGFPMLFGLQGQVQTTDYPEDWYEVKGIINSQEKKMNVLFLPWHHYMDYKWIPNDDKRISNPANAFFGKNVIISQNPEMMGISSPKDNTSRIVRQFLNSRDINYLTYLNIRYIILTKEADYLTYMWLIDETQLNLVIETPNLYVLEINAK